MSKKMISILSIAVFAPVFAFAFVNATTLNLPATVEPGATVNATLHVSLSNGDQWKSTNVHVSIPGPNNDIDVCVDTNNKGPNGSHQNSFSFTAPNADGDYTVTATAYEGGFCSGENDSSSATLHVVTPEPDPEPEDLCPNVDGIQESTPCADEECPENTEWNTEDQVCGETVVDPQPEEETEEENEGGSSSKSSSTLSGGGGFTYCDLHNGIAVTDMHNCIDRTTGKVVQTLQWRANGGTTGAVSYWDIVDMYMKVLPLLEQIKLLLSTK